MQIKAYLHRYSVSSSRFFIRPTQGIFVPSKIAVLKIAAFHCSFGVIHSTRRLRFAWCGSYYGVVLRFTMW